MDEGHIGRAENRPRLGCDMDFPLLGDEALEEMRDAIGSDRVHADDDEREENPPPVRQVDQRVKRGQEKEGRASAVEGPTRSPEALNDRADAELAEPPARRE